MKNFIIVISILINIALISWMVHYNQSNLVKAPDIYVKTNHAVAGLEERGTPIDRYYIEKFLFEHKDYIKGHALEMGSPQYIQKYGENITSYDILDLNPKCTSATMIGDLQNTNKMPANKFDSYILTQTLQYPYDIKATLKSVYKMMKKNGAVLITVPFVSPVCDDPGVYEESWRFTKYSLRRLLEDAGFEVREIKAYGNEFASTMFLQGVALEDIKNIDELEYTNEYSPMVIAALAIKH